MNAGKNRNSKFFMVLLTILGGFFLQQSNSVQTSPAASDSLNQSQVVSGQQINGYSSKTSSQTVKATGLQVLQGLPSTNISIGDEKKEILVVFNQPVKALGHLESIEKPVFQIVPQTTGKFRWYGSRICAFVPDKKWQDNQSYQVIVPKGLRALSGDTLNKDYSFRFKYIVPDLKVKHIYPRNRKRIKYKPVFQIHFDYEVSLNEVRQNLDIFSEGKKYPYHIQYMGQNLVQNHADKIKVDKSKIQIRPLIAFGRDQKVKLYLYKGIKALYRNTKLKKDMVYIFQTYGPIDIQLMGKPKYYQYHWGYYLKFSNPVDKSQARQSIQFEPHAPLVNTSQGQTKYLYLHNWYLEPGKTYKLSISGLKDIYGNSMRSVQTMTVSMPNYRPYLYSKTGHRMIEAAMKPVIGVRSVNVSHVDMQISNLTLAQLQLNALGEKRYALENLIHPKNKIWHLSQEFNNPTESTFDLSNYLNQGFGWLYINMKPLKNSARVSSRRLILQSTDMGMLVKENHYTAYVWVHSLTKGKAQKNVQIEHFIGNKKNGECLTNEQGFCVVQKKQPGVSSKSLYVAQNKSDKSFVTGRHHRSYHYLVPYNLSSISGTKKLKGAVIFDRGLYRPGDKMRFKAILSERFDGNALPLKNKLVHVILKDSRGKKIFDKRMQTSSHGSVHSQITLNKEANLGHYSVFVYYYDKGKKQYISETFQVEEYRPVNFSVTIKGAKETFIGNTQTYQLAGKYLFGAAMTGANVSWSAQKMPNDPIFENLSDFSFTDESWRERPNLYGFYGNGSGKLNHRGEYSLALQIRQKQQKEQIGQTTLLLSHPFQLRLSATVQSIDRSSVSNQQNIKIFPGQSFIGINIKNRFLNYKKRFSMDIVAVDKNGQSISGRPIDVYVVHYKWKTVKVKGPSQTYYKKNMLLKKIVFQKKIFSKNRPQAVSFQVPKSGEYWIIAKDSKTHAYSRTYIYAGGENYSWHSPNDDSVALLPDKQQYRPGEKAKILIQSPYASASAIVTLERDDIYWQKKITITKKKQIIEIPISKNHFPNVYVAVMLIKPRSEPGTDLSFAERVQFFAQDRGKPAFQYGVTKLNVTDSSKKLPLKIFINKKDFSPGERVVVRIQSRPNTELAVSVADRAVLDLIDYYFPDLREIIYAHWPLMMGVLENRSLVLKQYLHARKGNSPGGGGNDSDNNGGFVFQDEDGTRKNFRYTAYWNPVIQTDNNGHAQFSFKLPDNLTTFRIMAIGVNGDKYASTHKEFRVKKALVVQKVLPRFLRLGDTLHIGATLTNQTKMAGYFYLQLYSNMLISPDGKQIGRFTKTVYLRPGITQEVSIPVTIHTEKWIKRKGSHISGYVSVKPFHKNSFEQHGYGAAEISDKSFFSLPVQIPRIAEAFTVAGFTNNQTSEYIHLPQKKNTKSQQNYLKEQLSLSLSSSALIGLEKGFHFFQSNPYFCLEQRASAFLLAMTSGKLLKQFGHKAATEDGYDFGNIKKLFLGSLHYFQNKDGGFRLWEKNRYGRSNPYLTTYTIFVLQEAMNNGYSFNSKKNAQVLAKAMLYLKKQLKANKNDQWGTPNFELLALQHYIFVRANQAISGLETYLWQNQDKLSLRANAYLLMAMLSGDTSKKQSRVDQIWQDILSRVEITTRRVMFKEKATSANHGSFYTKGSVLGVLLQAMLQKEPNHAFVPMLLRQIMDQKSMNASLWSDSHSTGNIALALYRYHQTHEKSNAPFQGIIQLGEKTIWNQTFAGNKLERFFHRLAGQNLDLMRANGNQKLSISRRSGSSSPGRLYYTMTLQRQPVGWQVNAKDNGIAISQEMFLLQDIKDPIKITPRNNTFHLQRGEIYLVRLTVVSNKPLYNFVLEDPIASSLEIVNSEFATTNKNLRKSWSRKDSFSQSYHSWHGAPLYEFRDSKVVIVQNSLQPGLNEFFYLVRANLSGHSSFPATHAKAMYEPEIYGNAQSMSVDIK